MNRIFITSAFTLLTLGNLTVASHAYAAGESMPGETLNPQAGQWSSLVAILDNNKNHYLLKTTVSDDPEACMTQLHAAAAKVKEQNGMVWTNPGKTELNYEKQASTPTAVKVLELRCVLEPFAGELVQKF